MEVHHHSHTHDSHKGRKKWTHYFWEFMMLFLAVFCGFLAENFREHKIEHKRAKQFAISLLNDLKDDTLALNTAINFGYQKMRSIDSLLPQLALPVGQWNDTLIYRYEGPAGRVRPFVHNSGTYDQMKSSGSLRYFEQHLSDLLNQYAVQATKTKAREDIHQDYAAHLLVPFVFEIMDSRVIIQLQDQKVPGYPLTIRKKDENTIALLINYNTAVQSTQQRAVVEYEAMLKMARQLIEVIKSEYHLD
jgi:hypothetical protein